jgi:hypothetical protein
MHKNEKRASLFINSVTINVDSNVIILDWNIRDGLVLALRVKEYDGGCTIENFVNVDAGYNDNFGLKS